MAATSQSGGRSKAGSWKIAAGNRWRRRLAWAAVTAAVAAVIAWEVSSLCLPSDRARWTLGGAQGGDDVVGAADGVADRSLLFEELSGPNDDGVEEADREGAGTGEGSLADVEDEAGGGLVCFFFFFFFFFFFCCGACVLILPPIVCDAGDGNATT